MDENEINNLIQRYTEGVCTPDEIALVETWFNKIAKDAPSMGPVTNYKELGKTIWSNLGIKRKKSRRPVYLRYAVAAVVMIAGLTTYYLSYQPTPDIYTNVKSKDIQPGGNSATLTLANGEDISLNSHNGAVATNPGMAISNNSGNGIVTYQLTDSKTQGVNRNEIKSAEVNTITTPKGGQYQLVLSDGTRVYLNAATRLQYPVSFAAGERKVSLISGEAYFEVAKDTKHPFIVSTEGQTLKVLGTHFNISAYPNETIRTTLSEGSVQLFNSSSLKKQILQPEQQALLTVTGFETKRVISTDEMAWKDGLFVFKQTPIADVLQQLSRWYNVDANYNDLPDITVAAELSRTLTLSRMMKGINFGIRNEGFKIQLTDGGRLEISKN